MCLKDYQGIIVYTIVFIFYLFSFKTSAEVGKFNAKDIPDNMRVFGQFKLHFFTIWTFVLQIVFIITAILDETSKLLNISVALQKRLGRTRAFLFNALVFPCSLLVMTVFWTIWHIDRELIFPKAIDSFFPVWLNHTLHTFIAVPLMIELALPKRYSFVQFKTAALVLTVYVTVYQLLYMSVYLRHGVWLYPVYGVLNWTQRLLFSLIQLFLCLSYQKIGIVIQDSKRLRKIRKVT